MNQIDKILQLTGKPSVEELESTQSPFAATMIECVGDVEQASLSNLCFRKACSGSLDFMGHCLRFNPNKRCSIDIALKHPYVSEFHNEANEPIYPHGPIKVREVNLILSLS